MTTTFDSYVDLDPTGEVQTVAASRRPLGRWLDPESPVLTVVGVLTAAAGFVMIGIAWSEIAALTNVALQMPYLVSAGITGLALVMVGLLLINLAARRQDGVARRRQTEALTDAVTQLRQTVEQLQDGVDG